MVEWLTVLRILEVPGSNLGPETGFKLRLLWFSSVLPGEFWDSASNEAMAASLHILTPNIVVE
jgi:hypothetical protein